jgi:uncharacterized repeat protein (TIGR01451 family)
MRSRMISKAIFAAAALCVAAAPFLSHAASNGAIETTLEQRKVVRAADGRERLMAADTVKPGDVIEYAATYRNTTREPVRNLEATLPIPVHTELVPGSTRRAKASLDARDFGDIPLRRTAIREGKRVEELVPYRDYRYLRWYAGELGAEMSVTFTARVKVVE